MTFETFQIKCKKLLEENTTIGLNLYFLIKTDNEYKIVSVSIDKDLEPILLDNVKNVLTGIITDKELTIIPFSTADERKNVIYDFDLKPWPAIFDDFFATKKSLEINSFVVNKDKYENVVGFIYHIGTNDNSLFLYCKNYPLSLIKKDKTTVLFSKGDILTYVKKDMLKLNFNIDFILSKDFFLILNLKVLEKDFNIDNLIKKAASSSIESIKTIDILDNPDYINRFLNNPTFSRKFMKLQKSKVFEKNIIAETIIKFIKNSKSLKDKFKYTKDGKMLNISNQKELSLLLKVLNDDVLFSELTNTEYDSLAKNPLHK